MHSIHVARCQKDCCSLQRFVLLLLVTLLLGGLYTSKMLNYWQKITANVPPSSRTILYSDT
jgi:hypothetical protein